MRRYKAKHSYIQKSVPMRIASIVFCIVLVFSYLSTSIYARYTSSTSAQDSARVAKFKITYLTDTFCALCDEWHQNIHVTNSAKFNEIGATHYSTANNMYRWIKVEIDTEVAIRYTVELKFEKELTGPTLAAFTTNKIYKFVFGKAAVVGNTLLENDELFLQNDHKTFSNSGFATIPPGKHEFYYRLGIEGNYYDGSGGGKTIDHYFTTQSNLNRLLLKDKFESDFTLNIKTYQVD